MHITKSRVFVLQESDWDEQHTLPNTSASPLEKQSDESQKNSVRSDTEDIKAKKSDAPGIASSLWSTWPRKFALVITLGLICAAAVWIPLLLTNILGTTKTATTITTSTTKPGCSSGCVNTTTSISSRLAFYSFDGNTNDATGVYSASGIASPTYVTGYVGSAIAFNASLSQRLSAPALQLNNRSFTTEYWFYVVNGASNNYAFFGQLSAINVQYKTLFLVAVTGKLDIGFFTDDTTSTRVLSDYTWYHAAFVYDISVQQQLIYIDGLLDTASALGVGAYLGTSGPITIGGADVYGNLGSSYLTGGMDHLTVSTRAKTACEILNDATLAAYFPFDGSFTDAGPNILTVTSSGASFSTGVVNQGLSLSGVNSYVEISGLTGLGRSNYAFSIAFWVYPIVSGVLAFVSSLVTGLGWRTPFVGVSASGNIVVQVYNAAGPYTMAGPILQLNAWTHIAHVYSPINGLQLYINGTLAGSISNATIYTASGAQNFLTIGNVLSGGVCYNPGTLITTFQGMIDEFRVYSRDLSAADAWNLAWS